uniref:Uncharacterized protein n=1 Tax=Xiphophorus maculatus TaxID=8083 RepID=A0A3B5PZP9_XIPMA
LLSKNLLSPNSQITSKHTSFFNKSGSTVLKSSGVSINWKCKKRVLVREGNKNLLIPELHHSLVEILETSTRSVIVTLT